MDELTRLARAAAQGDPEALANFIRAGQGDVWRFCAYLVDPQTADDLTQETYLRALRGLRRFRGDSTVRAWLLTIARRVCAAELEARRRSYRTSVELAAQPDAPAVNDPTTTVELNAVIGSLPVERRAAFVLTQVLGCSYHEAASVCGCPVGTIRSRVARARADLITAMAPGATDATNHNLG